MTCQIKKYKCAKKQTQGKFLLVPEPVFVCLCKTYFDQSCS
ncbi:hypothetical protein HMPREF1547_01703 [Blautia sp. KLE 1732]|nr:hypothetical protein HMPREF1547_01703 [Blautia sp. KLE 1732]